MKQITDIFYRVDWNRQKKILGLAWPNILTNISVPLISSVDTAFMGRLSVEHIAAVGAGTMIINYILWNMGFLRMSTTGLVAQSKGRNNVGEMNSHLLRALLLALLVSILIFTFRNPLFELGVRLLADENSGPLTMRYCFIRSYSIPARFVLMVYFGWMLGQGKPLVPMVVTIVVNVLNIVLSYLLVFRFGMEIDGVALGTVWAEFVGVGVCGVHFLIYQRKKWELPTSTSWLELKPFLVYLQMNGHLFVRTLLLVSSFALFYGMSAEMGTQVLAMNTIFMQFFTWMSYGIDGFAYAAETLVGIEEGKKDVSSRHNTVRSLFLWGLLVAAFYSMVYFILDKEIFLLFTTEVHLYQIGSEYMVWMYFMPLACFASFVWDGVFIGLLRFKAMQHTLILAFIGYGLTLWIFHTSNHFLWMSFYVFMIIRSIYQTVIYFTFDKNKVKN